MSETRYMKKSILIGIVAVVALATGSVAANSDTVEIEKQTIANATSFNVTYDTGEINSSSKLVKSHDQQNRTAVLAIELESTTIEESVDYGNQTETTIDYSTNNKFPDPDEFTKEKINITYDRSVTEVSSNGDVLFADLVGGGSSGKIDRKTILIGGGVILIAILLSRD